MEIVPEFTSLNSYYTNHGPAKNGGTQHHEMVEIEE